MFLPPQSLRRDIRKTNTANIKEISRLYSTLLSTWLADIDENDGSVSLTGAPAESVPMQFVPTNYLQWAPTFRARLGKLTEMLPHLRAQTLAARREGSTRGRWPFEKYKKLVDIQSAMVIDLVQVLPLLPLAPDLHLTYTLAWGRSPASQPSVATDVDTSRTVPEPKFGNSFDHPLPHIRCPKSLIRYLTSWPSLPWSRCH